MKKFGTVYKFLDVPASLITAKDWDCLDTWYGAIPFTYGYWFHVGDEVDQEFLTKHGFTAQFIEAVQCALHQGCLWIKFDIDA